MPGVRTVLIERGTTSKDQAALVKAAAGGPLKLALECTGVESSVHTAVYVSSLEPYFSEYARKLISNQVHGVRREGIYNWRWQERTTGRSIINHQLGTSTKMNMTD